MQGGEGMSSASAAADAGPREVVPVIGTPEGSSGFPGLYLARIPSRSFAGNPWAALQYGCVECAATVVDHFHVPATAVDWQRICILL